MNTEAIDKLTPRDAYRLGVLDERIRHAEQERDAFMLDCAASPIVTAASNKPKKPKAAPTAAADKQPDLPSTFEGPKETHVPLDSVSDNGG